MIPRVGRVVYVRAGAYTVQDRCAALVTKVHDEKIVDVTVFPGDGILPFAIKSVRKADEIYCEGSNKEIFWHWPPED